MEAGSSPLQLVTMWHYMHIIFFLGKALSNARFPLKFALTCFPIVMFIMHKQYSLYTAMIHASKLQYTFPTAQSFPTAPTPQKNKKTGKLGQISVIRCYNFDYISEMCWYWLFWGCFPESWRAETSGQIPTIKPSLLFCSQSRDLRRRRAKKPTGHRNNDQENEKKTKTIVPDSGHMPTWSAAGECYCLMT